MNVSNVSSTVNPYSNAVQNPWSQRIQDFQALQSALQSGNLSGAQQALAAFQQDQPKSSQAVSNSSASSQTSPVAKDLQALQSALQSGNLSGAQQAFASFKQDVQSAGGAHRAHHHHGGHHATTGTQPAEDTSTSATSSTSAVDKLLDAQA